MDEQFDPPQKLELALIRAEHQKKYQVMIEYLKEKVGEGIEYRNAIVRVVSSERGVYYELLDLPEEFSGAVGDHIERRFVSPPEAVALLARAVEATAQTTADNTRQFSVLALYTRRGLVDRKNCYVFDYRYDEDKAENKPVQIGAFQPDVLPLFYKIKLDADYASDVFEMERGIVFCMANAGDRHLLVRIPYEGDQVVDLIDLPTTTTIH